jgi:hypothetical protein
MIALETEAMHLEHIGKCHIFNIVLGIQSYVDYIGMMGEFFSLDFVSHFFSLT